MSISFAKQYGRIMLGKSYSINYHEIVQLSWFYREKYLISVF